MILIKVVLLVQLQVAGLFSNESMDKLCFSLELEGDWTRGFFEHDAFTFKGIKRTVLLVELNWGLT